MFETKVETVRVLFISWWWPFPADNGSKIRIYNLLRQLSIGHEVTLLSFAQADEATPEQVEHLREICQHVEVVPKPFFDPSSLKSTIGYLSRWPRSLKAVYSDQMADLVAQRAHQHDIVIASQLQTLLYLEVANGVPAILEEIQVTDFHQKLHLANTAPARFRARLTLLKMDMLLRHLFEQGIVMSVVSEAEQDYLQALNPTHVPVRLIPNGVDTNAICINPDIAPQPATLIYPGAVTYDANYDAVAYFIEEVLPLLRQTHPDILFRVTGGTGGVDIRHLAAQPNVEFTGYLPNVEPAIQASWATVVPLRVGGGSRLKILESMALGTPVISTSKGAQGLNVHKGQDILLADDPADFAVAVERLLGDAELRARLVQAGRSLVEREYDWSIIGHQLLQFIEDITQQEVVIHG